MRLRRNWPGDGECCIHNRVSRRRFWNAKFLHKSIILFISHYCDAIMGTIASQITSLTMVYSTVYSGADQWKHQSSASLAFVWGIHRGSVNYPHKWPVTRKMFPFDDVIMSHSNYSLGITGHTCTKMASQVSNFVASPSKTRLPKNRFTSKQYFQRPV